MAQEVNKKQKLLWWGIQYCMHGQKGNLFKVEYVFSMNGMIFFLPLLLPRILVHLILHPQCRQRLDGKRPTIVNNKQ